MYLITSAFWNHKEREHGFAAVQSNATSQTNASSDVDRVYNYTCQALLLLRMDHDDAIKLADGERVLGLYKFFCLYYSPYQNNLMFKLILKYLKRILTI